MIWVYDDPEQLSQAAAGFFVQQAQNAVQTHGMFTVALSGGTTPRRTYQLLSQEPYRDQVPWENVHVFWGDERCVPFDDPRNNARMAHQALLDHVPVPSEQIHPIHCEEAPMMAALQYEKTLKGFFYEDRPRFDLILLGLGTNGHTASLFPGTPVIADDRHWVAEVYVEEIDEWRVTLTAWAINQATVVAFLVEGQEKAGVLRQVLQGARESQRLPAQLIQPEEGQLIWFVDRQASSLLKREV